MSTESLNIFPVDLLNLHLLAKDTFLPLSENDPYLHVSSCTLFTSDFEKIS